MASHDIATRDQIDPKYTWDLADIYKDDDAWETDYTEGQKIVAEAGRFKGCLAGSPARTYECLSARSELHIIVSRLYQYAYLNKDLDNRVSRYQAMTERAAMLSSMAGAAFSFVEPELLAIDQKELEDMAAKFPNTDEYDFYIKELIRSKAHVRSAEVEEVLALASNVTRGPDTIFSMLDDADLEYPIVKDEKGEDVQLTKQRFYKFLESSDRRVRRESNDAFYSSYKKHLNTLSASLASSVNGDVFTMRTRKYDSCLHASLDGNNIPVSVYDSLIDTTEGNLEGLHAWTALRKRVLKLDEIMPYDMMCPLFPDQDYEVPWDDAVRQVIEAAAPLGEQYCAELKTAFDKRWVDVYESQGKGSGAYNFATYTVHPYVLMNYNGTVDNMFTLAHEMGHAMHSHLANKTQCFPKARYALFVAEVASTLNEGLLLDYLLKKVTDTPQRLYLLNRAIDNAVGTFFHQVLYGHFELNIHQEVEKGNALSPAAMNQRWKQLTEKFFGPELVVDEYTPIKWSRIPHFYNAFYVYQYATSFAASQMILTKSLAGEKGIIERYLKMLSAGGSDHPIELLKICGVDMTTPDPVRATLKMFADHVAEVDRLTK
ncbi:MAG: oligoendopeptidase F [candidate division Zixibacteria bacterium]|nr:oligoendopeptidase F [candidate division Zixibacteria bacterium]